MRIEGPALKPEALKAELRLPKVEIGPAPGAGLPANLTLHNAAPIVAVIANSALTVQNARLTGHATDISITARCCCRTARIRSTCASTARSIWPWCRNSIPISRVRRTDRGRRATGPLDAPQINGRMQFQNAAFNIVDFPNGISNANG